MAKTKRELTLEATAVERLDALHPDMSQSRDSEWLHEQADTIIEAFLDAAHPDVAAALERVKGRARWWHCA